MHINTNNNHTFNEHKTM